MDYGYSYITFHRSRFQFLIIFTSLLFLGAIMFGSTSDLTQVLSVFTTLFLLVTTFFYLYYLTFNPVIEISKEEIEIKEIYHPIFKWRFIFKTHTLRYLAITDIIIKRGKTGKFRNVNIHYNDGVKLRKIRLNKNDLSDFDNFTKLLLDRSPHIKPTYVN